MKYWVLAYRLELIQKGTGKGSDKIFITAIYYIGLVVNIVSGLIYGIPILEGWIYIIIQLMQLCILVSCAFLIDAFKRLRRVKSSDQVISSKPVVLLIISFGAYGLAQIFLLTQMFARNSDNPKWTKTFYCSTEFDRLALIVSCITLTMILHELNGR
jgi:hypothetical protein